MSYQISSIQNTRDNLAEIIERVAVAGEKFVITKFGKAKAIISPVLEENLIASKDQRNKILDQSFGLWKDRKDVKNASGWQNKQRKPRYEKIFD